MHADAQCHARQQLAVETPFALGADRLFRAELVRLGADEHVLILTAHHVVCDGWSCGCMVRELAHAVFRDPARRGARAARRG